MRVLITFLSLLALTNSADAAAGRRFALVVGANRGTGEDQPLRFAEADATRMSSVLRDLGGFSAGDVIELKTPSGAELLRTMELLSHRIADEVRAGRPPLLLFYYSGHADGDALHSAGDRLPIEQVSTWLAQSNAAVRLAVLDSCRSGALSRVKGAHAAPAIEIRLSDEMSTRGQAVLTASTSDEMARESDGLRGSYFTHHLVSGLRGAADRSRDGHVTLTEAYDYAYAHTVAQAAGGQHPTFKYDLAGRGEVVLTSLSDAGAWLSFGEGTSGRYLVLGTDGVMLGEVDVGTAPLKVGVGPGRYEIRKHLDQGDRAVAITLNRGEEHWIRDDELRSAPTPWFGSSKGDDLLSNRAIIQTGMARQEIIRKRGRNFLIGGVACFAASLSLLGPLIAVNNGRDTPVISPFIVGGLIASTSLMTLGGIYLTDSNDELRRLSLLPPNGNSSSSVLLARARARAVHRRSVGQRALYSGFGLIGVGAVLAGVGGYYMTYGHTNLLENAWPVALMSIGSLIGIGGVSASIVGGSLVHSGRRDLQILDEGLIEEARPATALRVAPTVLPGGAGINFAGTF